MFLLRYATRNLARQKARSALTLVAVVLAVALVTLGYSFVNGMSEQMLSAGVRQTGHARLRNAEYSKRERIDPLEHTIENWRPLKEKLEKIDGVTLVTARINFGLMIQHTDSSTIVPEEEVEDESLLTDAQIFGRKVIEGARGLAVEPAEYREIDDVESHITAGDYFDGLGEGQALLGRDVAQRLGISPGDTVQLISYRGGISDANVEIVGVFDMGNTAANRVCLVPISVAEALLDMGGSATELLIFGTGISASEELVRDVRSSGLTEGLELKEWSEIGLFRGILPVFRVFTAILIGLILVVAGTGLLNTMLMTVLERQREIGVLLALGLGRRQVVTAILAEAGVFSVLGSAIGAVLGIASSLYFEEHGIQLSSEQLRKLPFPMGDTLGALFTVEAVVWGVAVGVIVSLVGALLPALRASGISPIEAIRRPG